MRKEKTRAHEVIAQAMLDSGLDADKEIVVEISYKLANEFRQESDHWNFYMLYGIMADLPEVIQAYREKYHGTVPKVVFCTHLKGDEVNVVDVQLAFRSSQ